MNWDLFFNIICIRRYSVGVSFNQRNLNKNLSLSTGTQYPGDKKEQNKKVLIWLVNTGN
jgi:hypothetical protein